MHLAWLVMVGAWSGPTLGVPAPEPEPIYGGQPTAAGEWDAVIGVLAHNALCTGTVIAPRLAITAAHCLVSFRENDDLKIYYGPEISEDEMITLQAESTDFGVHPEFCGDPSCRDDIFDYGYVILPSDFTVEGGLPAPITDQVEWDETMNVGDPVTLVGYGESEIETPDKGIGIKRQVTIDITDLSPLGLEFQAGGDGKDSCVGDSGGPAFVQLPNGEWRLAGITSRGSNPCGGGGYYGTPFAALFWLRDETGVDLLPSGCDDLDCLDTAPDKDDGRCSVDASGRSPLALWLLSALALCRRRARTTL